MKVYYAHPICIQGSLREKKELEMIRTKFPGAEVIDPSDRKYHWQKATSDMEFFVDLAASCDVVVYSTLFGKVTSGVGLEANAAIVKNRAVYRLEGATFISIDGPVEALTRKQTRDLYQRWWKLHPRK